MATLSIKAAYRDARKAGFSPSEAVIIVAIAIAESGLRTDAIGPVGEIGVTQVYPKAHPQYSRACLINAQCNFDAAFQISNHGTNWHPWTTYNNGAYRQNVSKVEQAVGASAGLPPDPSAPQQPLATPAIYASSSSQDGGLAIFGVGIGAIIAGAVILIMVGFVVWKSV